MIRQEPCRRARGLSGSTGRSRRPATVAAPGRDSARPDSKTGRRRRGGRGADGGADANEEADPGRAAIAGAGPAVSRPLRIGIDAHAIGERRTGNERFIANLVPALQTLCEHRFVLYFTSREAEESWPPAPRTETRLLRPANPLIRIPATLAYRAARDRLDVL